MAGKRFRTRRENTNTTVWAISSLILALIALALLGMTGLMIFVQVALGISAVGFVVSWAQDRKEIITYSVEGDQLLLKRRQAVERVALDLVQDASLVDRRAARDLLLQRLREMEERGAIKAERDEFQKSFTRWCTVDIGLRSFTFGIGRELIDRRPDGKHDLVLIRLRDGRAMLLSPVYNQDMVESLSKLVHQTPGRQHRA